MKAGQKIDNSFVAADPKGTIVLECGQAVQEIYTCSRLANKEHIISAKPHLAVNYDYVYFGTQLICCINLFLQLFDKLHHFIKIWIVPINHGPHHCVI